MVLGDGGPPPGAITSEGGTCHHPPKKALRWQTATKPVKPVPSSTLRSRMETRKAPDLSAEPSYSHPFWARRKRGLPGNKGGATAPFAAPHPFPKKERAVPAPGHLRRPATHHRGKAGVGVGAGGHHHCGDNHPLRLRGQQRQRENEQGSKDKLHLRNELDHRAPVCDCSPCYLSGIKAGQG